MLILNKGVNPDAIDNDIKDREILFSITIFLFLVLMEVVGWAGIHSNNSMLQIMIIPFFVVCFRLVYHEARHLYDNIPGFTKDEI